MISHFLLKFFILGFTFSCLNSFAQSNVSEIPNFSEEKNYAPYVGLSLGVGAPESRFGGGGEVALQVGFQPLIPFSVGGELAIASYSEGKAWLTRTALLVHGAYNFGGEIPFLRETYVGMAIGPMWEDDSSEMDLALGIKPNLGFDYELDSSNSESVSLGANLSYLISTRDNPDVLGFRGVMKYWF